MPPQASSSSSPDEAVVGTTTLPAMDTRAHQALLRRVAQNLSMHVEEVSEETDPKVDILSLKVLQGWLCPSFRLSITTKVLRQTPVSIPSMAKG